MKEVLYLQSIKELKAVSHPFRMAIIKLFGVDPDEPLSVKMIAEKLNEPASKIHYHLKELEKIKIVEMVKTREINGILEKFFLPTAKKITIKKDVISSNENVPSAIRVAIDMLEYTKNKVQSLKNTENKSKGGAHLGTIHLTSEEVKEIANTIEEITKKYAKRDNEDTKPYEFLMLFYPQQ